MNFEDAIDVAVCSAVAGSADPHVIVTPLVWKPSEGHAAEEWYFTVAVNKAGRCFITSINIGPEKDDQTRSAFILGIINVKPPRVVHDFGDELQAAKLCGALWPSEETSRLRKAIEEERAGDA